MIKNSFHGKIQIGIGGVFVLFLFTFMITVILTFIFIALYNHQYRNATVATLLFIGITIMLVANTIYQVHIGGISSSWINNNRGIYDFIIGIRFSFSSMQMLSLIGEVMVLFSILTMTNIVLLKKKFNYIFFTILLGIYFIINTPNLLYKLYLSINSTNISTVLISKNLYFTIYIIKLVIVTFVFLLPFISCIFKFFTRSFSIIKRNILLFASLVLLLEIVIVVLIRTKYINSFFVLNLTIFYSNSFTALVTEKVITSIIGTFFILLLYLILKSKLFGSNYFDGEFFAMYDGSKKLDKTLRMILHTYKNMFLAINQLSKAALATEGTKNDTKSVSLVNSIEGISKDALYNITHLLYMLSSVEITPQILDIREVIDNAVAKTNIKHNINIKIDCPSDKFLVNSDDMYMTDLIYNIFKNACDAVENADNPEISITVHCEDDWILIEIKDNGYGIPKDMQKQIFKPLVSTKQGSNNWGIGLYYAKKIVKSHNGHIFVESSPNKYTKFEIFLPVTEE